MNNKKTKEQALEILESVSLLYGQKIEDDEVSPTQMPGLLKEIWNLVAGVEAAGGKLDQNGAKLFENLKDVWITIQGRADITDEDIEAAVLPYQTSTGRKTVLPVYKTRFDA